MTKTDALRVRDYLAHIVEAIDRIDRYVDGMTELTFLSDDKTQDAVVRNFEILGRGSEQHREAAPSLYPGECRRAMGPSGGFDFG